MSCWKMRYRSTSHQSLAPPLLDPFVGLLTCVRKDTGRNTMARQMNRFRARLVTLAVIASPFAMVTTAIA